MARKDGLIYADLAEVISLHGTERWISWCRARGAAGFPVLISAHAGTCPVGVSAAAPPPRTQ